MSGYTDHFSGLQTAQNIKAKPGQILNASGHYVFQLDKWQQLERFLILGSDAPTYYANAKELTVENAQVVLRCIEDDGPRVVGRIVAISEGGRAPKNDPAIFALAMCAGAKDMTTRYGALAALPKVCRIGTHLFHFVRDVEHFRRWGRSLRTAVANWYTDGKDDIPYDLVKYQSRDGWSHRDVIRLAHPKPKNAEQRAAFQWVTQRGQKPDTTVYRTNRRNYPPINVEHLPAIIRAFEEIHSPGVNVARAIQLITEHGLPHECVPNELKDNPQVWDAMLPSMGLTAMIRNLGKMTSIGLISPMTNVTKHIFDRITSVEAIKKSRVHPMAILLALSTYRTGHGVKGNLHWDPVSEINDALNDAFYKAFDNVEPTGKNTMLALDVSGSMTAPMGGTHLSCREAAAAMAMITARTEKNWIGVAFTGGIRQIDISPKRALYDVVESISRLNFSNTNCSLPMIFAIDKKLPIDTFVVYTDNETNTAGDMHPYQALQAYRRHSGIRAKLIVVGMTSTGFTIADPSDAGMLDVVGFDAATPQIISQFSLDEVTNRT